MNLSSMLSLSFLRRRQVRASGVKRCIFLIICVKILKSFKEIFHLRPPPWLGVARNGIMYESGCQESHTIPGGHNQIDPASKASKTYKQASNYM